VSKIRVLIVDDAVVIRKLVTDALSTDPELEIVGSAANGRIALQKIPQCNPDVITLDVEMPELNGLETLRQLRPDYPKLPVIMFSTLTERGAQTTLDALALGASDYVTKPAAVAGGLAEGLQKIREELIPRIKALCRKSVFSTIPELAPFSDAGGKMANGTASALVGAAPMARAVGSVRPASGPIDVLVIGVSTGGPNALAAMLPQIKGDLQVPVLIVQHMPAMFTKLLAERLDSQCKLRVREAADGDQVQAGTIYIAPGDFHMTLQRRGVSPTIVLNQEPPENSCRPAVDVLFRSATQLYGPNLLAVVLTGMGQDGLRGCEDVAERGGRIFVQDEASSVVWGMPGFVARAGLAQKVLPLENMAVEIVRAIDQSRSGGNVGPRVGVAAVKAQ
jgi:two-component system, chemotaxis family, protein-glutamate methylesterase/glutaminase